MTAGGRGVPAGAALISGCVVEGDGARIEAALLRRRAEGEDDSGGLIRVDELVGHFLNTKASIVMVSASYDNGGKRFNHNSCRSPCRSASVVES